MSPERNILIQEVILRYEALPGVETVHSSLTLRAVQEFFKGNKIRLKCLATMFSMYQHSQEVELQEYPTQLALVMVPATKTVKGSRNFYFKYNLL